MEHAKHEEFDVMPRSVDDVPAGQEMHAWKLEVGLCETCTQSLFVESGVCELVMQNSPCSRWGTGNYRLAL